jgi:hypothetical protein
MERIKSKVKVDRRMFNGGPRYGSAENRGGARGNAGRKKGGHNKSTEALRQKAMETGELPHEFALRIMRLGPGRLVGGRVVNGDLVGAHEIDWDDIKWACALAAPYYAARLQAVRLEGKGGGPIQLVHLDPDKLKNLSDKDLDVLEKVLGEQSVQTESDYEADPSEYERTLQ